MFFDNGVAIKQKKLLPNYFEVSRKKRDLFFHLIYFFHGYFHPRRALYSSFPVELREVASV